MEIQSQLKENIGIISFAGKMLGEPADSKLFEARLNEMITRGIRRVILDLKHVQRINSTGLAILITATTLIAQGSNEKVALVGINDFIQGALTLTRLSQFFDYYDRIEDVSLMLEA